MPVCQECGYPMDQVGPLDDPLDLWGCQRHGRGLVYARIPGGKLMLVEGVTLVEFLTGRVQISPVSPPPLAILA